MSLFVCFSVDAIFQLFHAALQRLKYASSPASCAFEFIIDFGYIDITFYDLTLHFKTPPHEAASESLRR